MIYTEVKIVWKSLVNFTKKKNEIINKTVVRIKKKKMQKSVTFSKKNLKMNIVNYRSLSLLMGIQSCSQ